MERKIRKMRKRRIDGIDTMKNTERRRGRRLNIICTQIFSKRKKRKEIREV